MSPFSSVYWRNYTKEPQNVTHIKNQAYVKYIFLELELVQSFISVMCWELLWALLVAFTEETLPNSLYNVTQIKNKTYVKYIFLELELVQSFISVIFWELLWALLVAFTEETLPKSLYNVTKMKNKTYV